MRVLVVADPTDAEMVARAVEGTGHELVQTTAAAVALDSHRSQPADIAVVDCRRDGGTALCRRLRATPDGGDAVVIALVDHDGARQTADALAAGAMDCVVADVDDDRLRARLLVAEHLAREARRKRGSEQGLRRSEEAFRSLVETSPDWILVQSGEGFVYANPAAVRALGYDSREELLATRDLDLVHPDDHGLVTERQRELFELRRPIQVTELRMMARDGTVLLAEVSAQPIVWEGQPAALAYCRDVTERKQMQGQLMLADRMASVGTLAAGVAHELNNPLAYVISNLEVLREELSAERDVLSAERVRALDQLAAESLHGAQRMGHIVRDLKTFSRGEEEQRGPIDIDTVIRSSLNVCWNEIRHRARLVESLGEVPPVEANEARLGQVVLNLLINATQAMEEARAAQNVLGVTTWTDEQGWARLRIEDTGRGIEPQLMSRIFDPFFSTKAPGEGTGLGLSICRNIVNGLGGTLEVQSTPGVGTAFEIALPAANRRRSAHTGSSSTRIRAVDVGPCLRVLVVDDERMVGRAVRRTLREHEVTLVESAKGALDALSRESFDVVLCDLMMPDVSGMELHESIQSEQPEVAGRFVFMTGGAFTPRARRFLDTVTNPYLEKPFDPKELRTLIRDVGAGREIDKTPWPEPNGASD